MKRVGVLSLQGDFAAHGAALGRAGAEPVFVREAGQLDSLDALILPGGESTTMLKLLRLDGLFEALAAFCRRRPVFGTCAGAILMARRVSNPEQESLGLMDIDVERNAYGRQLDSRIVRLEPEAALAERAVPDPLEAVFIRAPIIRRVGRRVKVLASYGGDPVLVEEGPYLAATFHPELSAGACIHQLFLEQLA
jgi:5'-phosphate synthase pdxT subunit